MLCVFPGTEEIFSVTPKLEGIDSSNEVVEKIMNDYSKKRIIVIAPSSEGYFELNIDFTNADVSCTYKISFKTLESSVKDLIITSYIAPDGTTINVSNTTGNANNVEIQGTYTYGNNAATNVVQHYKINVKWNGDYHKYCNNVCMNKSPEHIKNVGDSLEKHYGVRIPAKSPIIYAKMEATNLRLRGVKNCWH